MEINKLSNQLNNRLQESGRAEPDSATGKTGSARRSTDDSSPVDDRVSVRQLDESASDQELARTELDKMHRERFEKLQELKAKLQEFQEAKKEVVERILETELGQKVEDPSIMEQIAQQMMDPTSRL